MTPDELKSIPKGHFVVMKTGTHPMKTRLRLFLDWGISFESPYQVAERVNRKVAYASRAELVYAIQTLYKKGSESVSEEHTHPFLTDPLSISQTTLESPGKHQMEPSRWQRAG